MIREKIEEMGYGVFLGLVAIIIVFALIYQFIIGNLFMALVAMGIAVIGCYYIFKYITEEEKPLELMPGEKLILTTLDRGAILFPRKKGKFLGKEGYRDLTIYLTSWRIVARSHNTFVLDMSLDSIQNFRVDERLKSKHIRATFLEKGKERDVLLFIGNTKLWMEKLNGLIKQDDGGFYSDVGDVKGLI